MIGTLIVQANPVTDFWISVRKGLIRQGWAIAVTTFA
jgi:hypothetical protein